MKHIMTTTIRITVLVISLCISAVQLYGQEGEITTHTENDVDVIEVWAGTSFMPSVSWKFRSPLYPLIDEQNKFIRYDMKTTSFSSYESNIRFPKIGLVFGANVNVDDTVVGQVDRVLGYLGFKNVTLKVSQGSLKGIAKWYGEFAPGMLPAFNFNYKITNIDLLYYLNFSGSDASSQTNPHWFYIGFGYTTFKAPIEVKTLLTEGGKVNQYYGKFVYDKSYTISAYAFLFGFDTLASTMRGEAIPISSIGLTFWGFAQDRIAIGHGTISNDTVQWAQTLNPGTIIVEKKTIISYLENDSSIGIAYIPPFLDNKIAFAIGYNLTFASVVTFEAAAETKTDLGYDANFDFLHHGVIFRIYAVW